MYSYRQNIASEVYPEKQIPSYQGLIPKWITCIFVFTAFSRELGLISLMGIDYDVISYNFFILYLIIQLRHLRVNTGIIIILFALFLTGLISKALLDFKIGPLLKQIIPIAIIYVGSYDVFCRVNYKELFRIYFKISYYTAIIGIIQFFLKLFFGIKLFTGYSQLFLDSIAPEPSHYAVLILPAVIYGLYYFKSHKLQSITLLIAILLTTSSTAYVVLLIMMLIIYRQFKYLIFVLPILYYLFNEVLLTYNKFQIRYIGFISYFEKGKLQVGQAATSISFLSNAEVAATSLKKNLLLGSGLGGHEEMYKIHFRNSAFRHSYIYGLNSVSAHSLLLRVISETGLLGFILYMWLLWKSLLFKADNYHRIISIACLSHFVGKALKLGGYFDFGTPFFVMLLLFNLRDYRSLLSANK